MKNKLDIYINLESFLTQRGFRIIESTPNLLRFEFASDKIKLGYLKYHELIKKGDDAQDHKLGDSYYEQANELKNLINKKYYPKLQPILDFLDLFYKNRDTEAEFKIYFNNNILNYLSLGYSPLYLELSDNKDIYNLRLLEELEAFDKFLEINK